MRKIYLFLFGIIFVPFSIYAVDFIDVEITRCYDGDTCTAILPGVHSFFQKMSVRLDGIDAPEIRGKCYEEKILARESRDIVIRIIESGKQIDLMSCKRDKYFRIGCKIFVDGMNLKDILLKDKNHFRDYDGGKRDSWCEET